MDTDDYFFSIHSLPVSFFDSVEFHFPFDFISFSYDFDIISIIDCINFVLLG